MLPVSAVILLGIAHSDVIETRIVTLVLWCPEDLVYSLRSDRTCLIDERFATHIAVGGDGPVALWHGDAGFETSDASVPGARHRLSMFDGDWRYERVDADLE